MGARQRHRYRGARRVTRKAPFEPRCSDWGQNGPAGARCNRLHRRVRLGDLASADVVDERCVRHRRRAPGPDCRVHRTGTRKRVTEELPTIHSLDELAELAGSGEHLYVRWSRGPQYDASRTSKDELTGVELPGLSANPLKVEPWWEGHPLRTWLARRLYDYRHLAGQRGEGVRPWVLEGRVVGRGPDNEPLIECARPIAWLSDQVVREATEEIEAQPADWGSLNRME